MVLAYAVTTYLSTRGQDASAAGPWSPIQLILIPLLIAILGLSVRAQLKRERASWDSFVITLSDNVLRRHAAGLPPIEILRPDVTRISESLGKGLTVATADRHRCLFVPSQLVGFDEAKARLAEWKPLQPPQGHLRIIAVLAATFVVFACQYAAMAIHSLALAAIPWSVTVIGVLIYVREVSKSPVMDNRMKARITGFLLFMIVATPLLRIVNRFLFRADGAP
jgi:hypothetical protein